MISRPTRGAGPDRRQYAPATTRNREPILFSLTTHLPARGMVLEVASGTGEHAAYFAPRLVPRIWQPSDASAPMRDSIEAWRQATGCDTLRPPIDLDVEAPSWPVGAAARPASPRNRAITAIVAINLLHIAPWSACEGLMAGAHRLLPPDGVLFLYGPFKVGGRHIAASNVAFDASLRRGNPEWGVRDVDAVSAAAGRAGLALKSMAEMPANNRVLVFRSAAPEP